MSTSGNSSSTGGYVHAGISTSSSSSSLSGDSAGSSSASASASSSSNNGKTAQTAILMALNFGTSVGIIVTNKYVFQVYHYDFPTLVTGLHFVFTFLGLLLCNHLGMFEIRRVPIREVIPLALAFTGFVVFNNLSLQLNSVGFYQLMKVMTTPTIVVLQYMLYGVALHPFQQIALVPICVGVICATTNDVDVNFWGSFWAIAGVCSTSIYQIWIKTKQQDLGLNSYQLLFIQAPVSAVFVFLISAFTEPAFGESGWLEYPYTFESFSYIIGSSLLAFLVNLSIFLVISKTSPIAYNVLGHFKLVVILLTGFVFFNEGASGWKLFGMASTLVGVIIYSHLSQSIKSGWDAREKRQPHDNNTSNAAAITAEQAQKLLGASSDRGSSGERA